MPASRIAPPDIRIKKVANGLARRHVRERTRPVRVRGPTTLEEAGDEDGLYRNAVV
jgi:hypothetical protein